MTLDEGIWEDSFYPSLTLDSALAGDSSGLGLQSPLAGYAEEILDGVLS